MYCILLHFLAPVFCILFEGYFVFCILMYFCPSLYTDTHTHTHTQTHTHKHKHTTQHHTPHTHTHTHTDSVWDSANSSQVRSVLTFTIQTGNLSGQGCKRTGTYLCKTIKTIYNMSLRHAGPYIWIPLPTLNFYLSPNLSLSLSLSLSTSQLSLLSLSLSALSALSLSLSLSLLSLWY